MKHTVAPLGSLSHGTLRPEDILPTLLSALDSLMEERSLSEDADAAAHGAYDDWAGDLERRMAVDGYYDGEDVMDDLQEVMDRLESFAPEGAYFGSHEGDGADFGFWCTHEPVPPSPGMLCIYCGEVV